MSGFELNKNNTEENPHLSKDYVTQLNYLGFLKISGIDAKKLLQGQLTCHLDTISPILSRLGAHCNPQGRIISFFRLIFHEDSYYLLMPRVLIPLAHTALKKYAIFYKVMMEEVSDHLLSLGWRGQSLQTLIPQLPSNIDDVVSHESLLIINHDHRYLIIGLKEALSEILTQGTVVSEDRWHADDIRSQIPTLYPETSELFLPHDLNLPGLNAVSFNKGCYTGQEIIARMHYRGKIKKKLRSIQLDLPEKPVRGSDIEMGSEKITIVDYSNTSHHLYELLIIGRSSE